MSGPDRLARRHALPELWDDAPADDVPASNLRKKLTIAVGIFAVLFLMAAFVPIGGAVLGSGQVGVASRVKRISHPTGGVISEIDVRNGQHVEAGQLLMRLDDRVTGADALYSNLTVEQLLAQRARLEAERLGKGTVIFPPELTNSKSPAAAQAMSDERRLFDIRASEQNQLRAQLAARVSQYSDEISGYQAQIAALRKQLALIEPERKSVRELWEKQLVTITRLNDLERTATNLEGNIASLDAQIASARARITEAQEQSIQVVESRRAEAGKELSDINTALNQQQLRSVAATDQHTRSEIRAPYSGTIEKLAFYSVNDVVKPAEPIMEIVPDSDQLVIETMISPDDVDQLHTGQQALVRFPSINRAATPEIYGKLTYVATDRSENPESRQSYFVARVSLDETEIASRGLKLRSGMPAEVHIQTGDRSMLSYVFKPLRDQFSRAFRNDS